MKKKILITIGILGGVLLTGCGKKSPEAMLCDFLNPKIEMYEKQQLSYDDFASQIKNNYEETCKNNNDSSVCTSISLMYDLNQNELELKDCSIYNENDKFGKELKNACETTNTVAQNIWDNREKNQKNAVMFLKDACEKLK